MAHIADNVSRVMQIRAQVIEQLQRKTEPTPPGLGSLDEHTISTYTLAAVMVEINNDMWAMNGDK